MSERKQKVLHLAEKYAFQLRQEYVGKVMKVLFESDGTGHTENFLPVQIFGERERRMRLRK